MYVQNLSSLSAHFLILTQGMLAVHTGCKRYAPKRLIIFVCSDNYKYLFVMFSYPITTYLCVPLCRV